MLFTKDNYTIAFNDTGQISALSAYGKAFVVKSLPQFSFRMRKGEQTQVICSDQADRITPVFTEDTAEFEFVFTKEQVTFRTSFQMASRIQAAFRFLNDSDSYIEWVDFPQISVPNDLVSTGGSGRLVQDINEGLLVEDIVQKESYFYLCTEPIYPSYGLSAVFPAAVQSQFLAYYDNTAGLYVAAEDAARSVKGVDFKPLDVGLMVQFKLYPGVEKSQREYVLPFPMVIDFFRGDWHDAAELYRNWFEKNLPENLVAVEDNDTLPQWYQDSPLVVTYPVQGIHDMDEPKPNRLFPYNNALPHIDELSDATNSRILTVLMHWEGTAPWAPPYVWPPLGGEEMLKDFCEKLHRKNHLLGVYCSGMGYTINSNLNGYSMEKTYENEGLAKYMCASPAGLIDSQICQMQRKSYDMCISQDFTKQVLVEEAKKMASSGLDYIQILDQNHGGTPYFCYSEQHGHPAVPGGWMVEGMLELLVQLKEQLGNNVLLGCESAAAEAYIQQLNLSDNRFNLNYSSGKPIPLYGYIYHKYLHNFSGNSVCSLNFIDAKRSPECYLLRVAHSFLAGDLMTLVITQDGEIAWSWGQRDFSYMPDRKAILTFIRAATAYRRGAGKPYLVFGEMVKPAAVRCETLPMYKPDSDFAIEFPAVLTTAWRASDGTVAQFLASYQNKPQACTVDLTGTKGADLLAADGTVLKTLSCGVAELEMPPTSVYMIRYHS